MQNSSEKRNNSKVTPFAVIRTILIIILVGVIGYEAVMIYRDQTEYSVAVNEYEETMDSSNAVMYYGVSYDKGDYTLYDIVGANSASYYNFICDK